MRAWAWTQPVDLHYSVDYAAVMSGGRMVDLDTADHLYEWGGDALDKAESPARLAALEDLGLSGQQPAFVYPPIVALAVTPWSRLPYAVGLVLWRLGSLVMALGGIWLWWEAFSPRTGAPAQRRFEALWRVTLVLALAYPLEPLRYAIVFGQTTPLVLLLVAVSMVLARRDREIAGGLVLALAASIKLTPAVFGLLFLLEGRWRAAISAGLGGLALLGASIVLMGWELHVEFLHALGRLSSGTIIAHNNASIDAFVGRYFFHPVNVKSWSSLDLPAEAALIAGALKLGLTALVGVWAWRARRMASEPWHPGIVANALALWLLLVPDLAWTHYYMWILPVVLVTFTLTPSPGREALLPALGLALAFVYWPLIPDQVAPAERAAYFIGGPTVAALAAIATLAAAARWIAPVAPEADPPERASAARDQSSP